MKPKTKLIIALVLLALILIKVPQARHQLSHLLGKLATSASHAAHSVHAPGSAAGIVPAGVTGTPSGNAALAQRMASAQGWQGGQWQCLRALWTRESGFRMVWNYQGSGAYGIPQSLPADKMASAGADWRTNPATQIKWGLGYIRDRYGTPCGAWGHETASNWY